MQKHDESGAISIAEALIVLTIGIVGITLWAQGRLNDMEIDSAKAAGRAIAAYSRAASAWIAENPPAASGDFDITSLQDCGDPDGVRYLSCGFDAQSPVKLAFNSAGERVNFGNLGIEVSVTGTGASGTIDFGVIRSGNDNNNDDLPDSRPDLAAIALDTASEETGAGVLDFFELKFVREDIDGVKFDQTDADFDQSEIDNLARLEAHVGARLNDVPFLRLDGTNEMSGGVRFDNGMTLSKNGNGLSFAGPGDVEVATTTGTLVASGKLKAPDLESDSAQFDSLTVDPVNGVMGDGFNKFDQSSDILRIDGEILSLASRVSANETTISRHAAEITRLDSAITDNKNNIDTNQAKIGTNATKIDDNSSRIQSLENNAPSTSTICTPSMEDRISALRAAGYGTYYDSRTANGNCSYGTNCSGVDRCGDTVRGTIRRGPAWSGNPVSYSFSTSSSSSCTTYSLYFYGGCRCRLPSPSGCR